MCNAKPVMPSAIHMAEADPFVASLIVFVPFALLVGATASRCDQPKLNLRPKIKLATEEQITEMVLPQKLFDAKRSTDRSTVRNSMHTNFGNILSMYSTISHGPGPNRIASFDYIPHKVYIVHIVCMQHTKPFSSITFGLRLLSVRDK